MPTYGYKCTECNHSFEVFQRITESPLTECRKCKGRLKKLLYPVGIVFKGSGFHVNDYKSDTSAVAAPAESQPAPVEEKTPSTPAETVPAPNSAPSK